MVKSTMLRLSDKTAGEVQKIADRKGLPFATVVKSIVVEHLNESIPAENPAKTAAGIAGTSVNRGIRQCQ